LLYFKQTNRCFVFKLVKAFEKFQSLSFEPHTQNILGFFKGVINERRHILCIYDGYIALISRNGLIRGPIQPQSVKW